MAHIRRSQYMDSILALRLEFNQIKKKHFFAQTRKIVARGNESNLKLKQLNMYSHLCLSDFKICHFSKIWFLLGVYKSSFYTLVQGFPLGKI